MTTYTSIRDALVTLIEGVDPDVGTVHGRLRWANNWKTFLDLFAHEMSDGSGNVIRGWFLTRTAIQPVVADSTFASPAGYDQFYRHNAIVIRGIMGFSDENDSESAFQSLVDKVVFALDQDANLHGASNILQSTGPTVVRNIEVRVFGATMCHWAELELLIPRLGD